jgi:hypothetical protein
MRMRARIVPAITGPAAEAGVTLPRERITKTTVVHQRSATFLVVLLIDELDGDMGVGVRHRRCMVVLVISSDGGTARGNRHPDRNAVSRSAAVTAGSRSGKRRRTDAGERDVVSGKLGISMDTRCRTLSSVPALAPRATGCGGSTITVVTSTVELGRECGRRLSGDQTVDGCLSIGSQVEAAFNKLTRLRDAELLRSCTPRGRRQLDLRSGS